MRLITNSDRREGDWRIGTVYIEDGDQKYGLNPNQLRTVRIFYGTDNASWMDVDLDRLVEIHRLMTEARGPIASPRQRVSEEDR